MSVLRERWFVAGCALLVAGLVAAAAGVWATSSALRAAWWTRVAARPLEAGELEALQACGEVGWSTWLKVLASDPELGCGEAWAARALGERANGADRVAWLEARVTDPQAAPGARMRAATALLVAGAPAPREPFFLVTELDEARAAAWRRAGAEDDGLSVQLGPRAMALRVVDLADQGELEPREALPVLRWLSATGTEPARAEADRALTRLTSVDAELAGRLRDRRSRRSPVGEPPIPERGELAYCAEPLCLEARLAVLEAMTAEPADGGPPAEEPEVLPDVPPELAEPGSLAAAALGWEVQALRRWLDAAPDRDARLRALIERPATGSVLLLGWDGSGTPWATADLLRLLREGEPTVRADRADTVWVPVGWSFVPRSCGTPATASPSTSFDEAAIRARAILELASDEDRASGEALARARALDPGLPLPPVAGDPVAFRIGAALAPPLAPEGDRGVGPAGPWCR